MKWLTAAADQGAPRALVNLGRIHEQGLGTSQDLEKARLLYERAARSGEFLANIYLGRLYRHGRGIPEDEQAARQWYLKAIEMTERVAACPEMNEAVAFVEATAS